MTQARSRAAPRVRQHASRLPLPDSNLHASVSLITRGQWGPTSRSAGQSSHQISGRISAGTSPVRTATDAARYFACPVDPFRRLISTLPHRPRAARGTRQTEGPAHVRYPWCLYPRDPERIAPDRRRGDIEYGLRGIFLPRAGQCRDAGHVLRRVRADLRRAECEFGNILRGAPLFPERRIRRLHRPGDRRHGRRGHGFDRRSRHHGVLGRRLG